MASQSLAKFYALANRSRETLKRYREKEKEKTGGVVMRGGGALSTVAGVCAAAAIDGKWGYDKAAFSDTAETNGIACIGPAPVNVLIGAIGAAVGIVGVLPGSEYITQFGAGMLAYPLGKTIEAHVHANAAKA